MKLNDVLCLKLAELEAAHLRRHVTAVDETLQNFAANDYLGLSRHPALLEAAATVSRAGAGASRLITGTDARVLHLEETLAAWKEKEAALVFSSGFAAALGTIPALVGPRDTVILDKLSHASLIDGARLSGATVRTFPHGNIDRLESLLRKTAQPEARTLIVTESIFSMDGDSAPLAALVELKDRFGAWLLVDEAHATGLYGRTGAGLIAQENLSSRVEVVLGTFSKALGSVGGYIAGSRTLIEWLLNRARSFVFSTALPPGVIAASHAAVQVVSSLEGASLRERLGRNIARFQADLPARWRERRFPDGAIQPLLVGEAATALELASHLRSAGFLVPAIRYPTVPRGAARLRITLSAAHADKSIDALNRALAELGNHLR